MRGACDFKTLGKWWVAHGCILGVGVVGLVIVVVWGGSLLVVGAADRLLCVL